MTPNVEEHPQGTVQLTPTADKTGDRKGLEAIRHARKQATVSRQVECHACKATGTVSADDGIPVDWQVVDLYHKVGDKVEQGTFVVCAKHDIGKLTADNRLQMLGEQAAPDAGEKVVGGDSDAGA